MTTNRVNTKVPKKATPEPSTANPFRKGSLGHRRMERFRSWASKQPHDDLAVHFAGVLSTCLQYKEMHREWVWLADDLEKLSERLNAEVDDKAKALRKHRLDRLRGAAAKDANDPRAVARDAIRREWDKWQRHEVVYRGDSDFGRKMHAKHPDYRSDRSIAALAAKWRNSNR